MKKLFIFIIFIAFSHFAKAQTSQELYAEAEKALKAEDYKTALKKIDLLLKKDSSKADFFSLRSDALFFLKQYDDCFTTLNTGIKLFPNAAHLYGGRGHLMYLAEQFQSSIDDYSAAAEFSKTDTMKYHYIGERSASRMAIRDFQGCYRDLMACYAFDSTNLQTLSNLGAVCEEVGKPADALRYMFRIIKIEPKYFPAYINIGFQYQHVGKYEESIKYLDKAIEIQPNEALAYSNQSFNYYKLGKYKEAMKHVEKSLKLYPENSYAYKNRALIYIAQGKLDKACDDLQYAISRGFTEQHGDEVVKLQKEHCK